MRELSYNGWRKLSNDERASYTGTIVDGEDIIYQSNGKFHRLDGPALIFPGEDRCEEYWIHGKRYTKEQFESLKDLMQYRNL